MVSKMCTLLFAQLLLSLLPLISARNQFFVGSIFTSDKDESEIAFRTAVHRANILERDIELVPIVMYANTDDSFRMEKIVCNLISQGAIAIFGPSTGSSSDIIASICDTLDIPHIVYDWIPNESIPDREHSTMTLNVHPDNLLLSRGFAEIVQSFGWRSFTVAYESDKELQQLQDILQIGEPTSYPTTVKQLATDGDHRPFLKEIKLSTDNCLILHCSPENLLGILQQANELKMLGEYQSVFIPVLDTHTIDFGELSGVEANITTIRLMDPTDFHIKNVVHDWEEREKQDGRYYSVEPHRVKTQMILLNDAVWLFSKGLTQLGILEELAAPELECRRKKPWSFGRRIIEFMKARSEETATGRIDFNEYGQRSFFTLRFMELSSGGFTDLATWDPVNGLDVLNDDEESEKRVGLKLSNKTFIVSSRLGAPFLTLREPNEGEILQGNARYEGYSIDLIDAIARMLNFKYEFRMSPDGKYGALNKVTQTWDGIVKQLIDGNADLGICDLTMTSSRRQAVDFTPPFMTLGISILFSKPPTPPTDLFSFLSPFSLDVWIYMGSAYLFISLLLFALARMAPDDWENPHPCKEPEEVENIWSIMNTTWLSIGSLMGQGCDILPKAASTRLVTGMWWFFALMMLNSYTANLAAFLTNSRQGNTISSAEDLAAQNKIKYGVMSGGSTQGFFRDSNFSTYQKMWTAMESASPSVFTKTNDEGVERVQKGKNLYAFFMESTTLEYNVERKCDLVQIGGWLDYKSYGIAMPFNSPYRKQISGAVLKLGELGQLAELKRKWWKEMHGGGSCEKSDEEGGDTPELGLENVGGVFLVLGLGLFAAMVLGCTEFLWNVKSVAIEEKISLKDAFKAEALFAAKIWIVTKPVHTSTGDSSSSNSSSSSSKSGKAPSSRSKHSSKSPGISMKSIKSSDHHDVEASVHNKLKKIGSMFSLKSQKTTTPPPEIGWKLDKSTQMDEIPAEEEPELQPEPEQPPHRHHHHHHHRHHHHHHHREEQPDPDQIQTYRASKISNGV
ncbi:glutamate receptor ionotropic, kainate 2 [Drosophila bipectinata]|uniref:glutamate receptor ionotropic, kainate 2 n=1 Tax=Drosophila bipectinata TaxID=42026 RepID=UPI001C8980D5|nr:glutamate receptor ionotropic, kainate 2 [Drosophila bipectinata]